MTSNNHAYCNTCSDIIKKEKTRDRVKRYRESKIL